MSQRCVRGQWRFRFSRVSQTQFRASRPSHSYFAKSLPKRLKCALGREMKVEAKTGSDTMQLQICSPDRLFRLMCSFPGQSMLEGRLYERRAIGEQYCMMLWSSPPCGTADLGCGRRREVSESVFHTSVLETGKGLRVLTRTHECPRERVDGHNYIRS